MADEPNEPQQDEQPPSEGDAAWREQTQRTQDDGSPRPPTPDGVDPRDNHA